MTLGRHEYEVTASSLAEARRTVKSCPPPTVRYPELSLEDAYAISRLQFARHLAASGARDAGRKIGLTSEAHRERYGVLEPTFGYVTREMRVKALSMKSVL